MGVMSYFNITSFKSNSSNYGVSGGWSFSTQSLPPVITNVNYTVFNRTDVNIFWTTDINSNTSVRYGTTTALGSHKGLNNNVTYIMENATLDLQTDIVDGTFVEITDQS